MMMKGYKKGGGVKKAAGARAGGMTPSAPHSKANKETKRPGFKGPKKTDKSND